MKIYDVLYRRDRFLMLRYSHRPTCDDTVGTDENIGGLVDRFAVNPTFLEDVLPISRIKTRNKFFMTRCLFSYESFIKYRAGIFPFTLKHRLHNAFENGHVAADPDRQMQVGKMRWPVSEDRDRKRKRIRIMLWI